MYLVLEIQKTGNQIATNIWAFETRNEADAKFYTVLAAAAISSVPLHAAALLTEDGGCIKNESYNHELEELNE